MRSDGAQLGVNAETAMNAALGGPQPTETQSAQEMAAAIMATTEDPHTYEGTANYCAHLIVDWLLADPTHAQGPTENEYEKDASGKMAWPAVVLTPGWYDRMKADGIALDALDLTGFMWGWAVNAARRCVELPEVPNPAIVTLGE